MVHVCFVKCGNIATSTVVDLLLDEIAARDDIQFTVLSGLTEKTLLEWDLEHVGEQG